MVPGDSAGIPKKPGAGGTLDFIHRQGSFLSLGTRTSEREGQQLCSGLRSSTASTSEDRAERIRDPVSVDKPK